MSDGRNASVIPFPFDDEGANESSRSDIAEVIRMAEAIVFASAAPVSE
jgi:segregation and condensation protein B